MTEQAGFMLHGRNPDVLTCIANLSNDEVFTPPEFANRMLDTLADAWATGNGGANIWASKSVKFLDPFTKSGVFLREITKRLQDGLKDDIPDLQQRVDHILTKQVFGIGITQLTALLARRSLYCSKHAIGEHSIAKGFSDDAGNIWFERAEHTWVNDKCKYCGASKGTLDRGEEAETHAYAFIHTDDIRARIAGMFGDDMQFDVIIGNPPYQLASDGGTRDKPIYQHFVQQAKGLEPRYLCMVIPSRWMAAGLGLAEFRSEMLSDDRIRTLVDFPASTDVFPGVKLMGGACFFLWDRDNPGLCRTILSRSGQKDIYDERRLDEYDILVRDSRALSIIKKVMSKNEQSIVGLLSADKEFGLTSNFSDYKKFEFDGSIPLYAYQGAKRIVVWVSRDNINKSQNLIDTWKVLIPAAGFESQISPTPVLSSLRRATNPSVCTQTYLFLPARSEEEASSMESYVRTRIFRYMVWLRKVSQHATRATYTWVPVQEWNRNWSDEELYEKYDLDAEEIALIEGIIRPLESNGG
ncbi:Eco57I restriction-modification methylase domain-containing protein (plasmid) [Acuticoccus sp. MNP-M23]|uniref:Eco57I restriction-modification methylase domain-containing protein n=1 Tax=Acuticoccus sp. MNP-M23 TaxID=3072793 RepID=UPI00281537C9|nr:Eco57I restriction-modification methylase domain-containing protein [Acuticoccus sp. MNP-M23]WMS45296.1 Eco57I restriction-modification methylase domain-containing protein [Acuticoccus sp. MNP-M23]